MNPSASTEVLPPQETDILPLSRPHTEIIQDSRKEIQSRSLGRIALTLAHMRIRINGYSSVEEVYEFPELQKIPSIDIRKTQLQLEQAIAYRKGQNSELDDEDETLPTRISVNNLAVKTTAYLLSHLQSTIEHTKSYEKIKDVVYVETAKKVIHKVLAANDSESSLEDNNRWNAELHPRNIRAFRNEIVNLAVQRGGKKETAMSVMSATGIYHIHPHLVAAYLNIAGVDWEQQLKGEKYIVPNGVLDKLNFLLQLDVETYDKDTGKSMLDIIIPEQTDIIDQSVGDTFVANRLKKFKEDLRRGRYQSVPKDKKTGSRRTKTT